MPFIIVHGAVENVNTLTHFHTFAHVLIENSAVVDTEKKCHKNIPVTLALSLKQSYIGLGLLDQIFNC